MPEEEGKFIATISRAGFKLTMRGEGNMTEAGNTLRQTFPGCAVSFLAVEPFTDEDMGGR